jgi:drug/metabolite transporter (DMT)-like permease
MNSFVFTAVLFAAFAHAAWNAAAKRGLDPLVTTVLMAICAGLVGLAMMPVVGMPAWPAWPWVVASALIHIAYFGALIEGYAAGDMGVVYPIARGAAPLMTAVATAVLIGERLGLVGWLGVILLAAGVGLLSLRRGSVQLDRRAIGFALLTAVTICVYTLVDGIGARRAGSAHAYTATMFAGIGIAMTGYAFVRRGTGVFTLMAKEWCTGIAGGALQVGSYGIAIWAMTVAPIALIAALRETSVLFGAVLAVAFLKEQLLMPRMVAALMIVGGLVMIRLA